MMHSLLQIVEANYQYTKKTIKPNNWKKENSRCRIHERLRKKKKKLLFPMELETHNIAF
jgi:predicted HAD superfamily Cof-like phosphohydrolase